MKILVFGGTGLIGKALLSNSEMGKHDLFIVTRKHPLPDNQNNIQYVDYREAMLKELFSGSYGIINLAGEGIGDRLWTEKRKNQIIRSRVNTTGLIVNLINSSDEKPEFVIQASAVGYYGNRGEEMLNEDAAQGKGFLPEVTRQWEAALKLRNPGFARIIFIRTGLVLSKNGGLLSRLVIPFKLFVGGYFGKGRQWMPWIHEDDEIESILFLMENTEARGVFNLVSPNPVRMKEFCSLLGKATNRPSWLHIPNFLIKIIPGGFGEELFLSSQRVSPANLLNLGYEFRYSALDKSFHNIFNNE